MGGVTRVWSYKGVELQGSGVISGWSYKVVEL